MKKLLLLLLLPLSVLAQTFPDSTIVNPGNSFTPQWRWNNSTSASGTVTQFRNPLNNTWNSIYTTYQINQRFPRKDSVLIKWKNLYDVSDKLTAYKNLNGYGVSLKSYGVSPSNTPTQNRVAIQNAIDSNPNGTMFYGDYSQLIKIDSTVTLTGRRGITIRDLKLETALDPLTNKPYTVNQLRFINCDSIQLLHTYHTANADKITNDTLRRDAIQFYNSRDVLMRDIQGHKIRKCLVEFSTGSRFTAEDISADSVYRDAVSVVKSQYAFLNNIKAYNSSLRGAFEFSDSTSNSQAHNILAQNSYYAFDFDKHPVSGKLNVNNIIVDGVQSIGNQVVADIDVGATDSLSYNWTIRNIHAIKSRGAASGSAGEFKAQGYVQNFLLENIQIDSSKNNFPKITVPRSNNLTVRGVKITGPVTNRILVVNNGTEGGKNLTIDDIQSSQYTGTVSAVLVQNWSKGTISNLKIKGTGTAQALLDIQNSDSLIISNNFLNGSTGPGILWRPTTPIKNYMVIVNNNIDYTTGISFTGNFTGTYLIKGTPGTFSKVTGTPLVDVWQNTLQLNSLTASLPLKLDASKNVTAAAVDLSGSEVVNALPATKGGTGQTTLTTGDLLYASATNTISKRAIGSTGNVLTVVGGIPAWAAPATNGTVTNVSVTTANGVSGSVATATTTPAITLTLGAITPTSTNGVSAATMAFMDATSSVQTQLNSKQPTITFGTGVLTALGINIGSAGAPVLFNGAGGTPSSMVGTNITGTAAGLTAGAATNAIAITGNQTGLTGNKETAGTWTFNSGAYIGVGSSLQFIETGGANYINLSTDGTVSAPRAQIWSDVAGKIPVLGNGSAPSSSSASGKKGDIRVDGGYVYICTSDNTWVRAAVETSF